MHSKSQKMLELANVHKRFVTPPNLLQRVAALAGKPAVGRVVHAVNGVNLTLRQGEVLGLVGESGCGKSTLGRIAAGLLPSSSGTVHYQGQDVATLTGTQRLDYILGVQMIFQDPQASLNPRQKVYQILQEAPLAHKLVGKQEVRAKVDEVLRSVGLEPAYGARYPHQISGGQRQRIGIARALLVNPNFLVCDEPVAALDVSIQAQVINLFLDLRAEFGFTYLFISHDLGVVRHIADRVAIMYLGKIVELAPTTEVFSRANHPYTQALIEEVPDIKRRGRQFTAIKGEIPSPLAPPSGCAFHPRCPRAMPRCHETAPDLQEISPGHWSACHLNTL